MRSAPPPPPDALAWISLALLLGTVGGGLLSPTPRPADADVDPATFATERALPHLRIMAREPHPTSTPANAEVRAYLQRELAARGLEVETQVAQWNRRGYLEGEGELVNILARRAGTDSTGTVALVSHHDSAPWWHRDGGESLGAADDAAAVAATLEVLRALDEAPPLRNDLVVVITDAEELGLDGARAFLEHPWCADVDIVLNFEGRGSSGPALMFQISQPNGWLVEQWADAAPDPVGSSVMADIYRQMPNDTDFTVFLNDGYEGQNFAFVDGYEVYHTARDTVENLDLATLQHHGETMLALTQRYGNLDLAAPRAAEELVYFNPVGSWLVYYPQRWNWPQVGIVGLLLLVGLWTGLRRGRLTGKGLVAGIGVQLLSLVLGVAVAFGIARGLLWSVGGDRGFSEGDEAFFVAIALAVVAVVSAVHRLGERAIGPTGRLAGTSLGWLALLVLACCFLPGGSYVSFWPALAAVLVVLHDVVLPPGPRRSRVVLLLATAVTLPCLAATYYLFQQGLMLAGAWAPAPLLVLVLGPIALLLRPFGRGAILFPLAGALGAAGLGVTVCLSA